jgi:hypothetical protein
MTTSRRLIAIPALLAAALVLVPAVALATGIADDGEAPGTIALRATEVHGLALGTEGMMPGDSITGTVVLRNDGDAELRYAITTSAVDHQDEGASLSSILAVTVTTADADAASENPCAQRSGSVLRERIEVDRAARLVGDSAAGSHHGDRHLGAGGAEILCFTVELPTTAGNEFQGLSSTISFGFTSEATAGNP